MTTIRTYDELAGFIRGFAAGHIKGLVICSRGGLGKSEHARRTLAGHDVVFIGGHVTPLALYAQLYDNQSKPIVFDEIDGLLAGPQHVGLLKQLCETRSVKRIQWMSSDRRALEIDGGKGYFHTTSRVLMLCNSFHAENANVAAFETRLTLIRFEPSSAEILKQLRTFATDPEIVAFLTEFHNAIPNFTLRTYCRLSDMKNAGLDWQRYALQETDLPEKVIEIADLLDRYDTDLDRLRHYQGSRRDYYNWKPQAKAYKERHANAARARLRIAGEDASEERATG